jgi:hypothetical protein
MDEFGVGQRREQSDHQLTPSQCGDGRVVGPADHEHGIGLEGVGPADDAGTCFGIRVIGKPGGIARAGLNEYVKAGSAQLHHRFRHQRNTSLAGRGLLDHRHLHQQTSLGRPGQKCGLASRPHAQVWTVQASYQRRQAPKAHCLGRKPPPSPPTRPVVADLLPS